MIWEVPMAILTQLLGIDKVKSLEPIELELLESSIAQQLMTNTKISEQLAGPLKARFADIKGISKDCLT